MIWPRDDNGCHAAETEITLHRQVPWSRKPSSSRIAVLLKGTLLIARSVYPSRLAPDCSRAFRRAGGTGQLWFDARRRAQWNHARNRRSSCQASGMSQPVQQLSGHARTLNRSPNTLSPGQLLPLQFDVVEDAWRKRSSEAFLPAKQDSDRWLFRIALSAANLHFKRPVLDAAIPTIQSYCPRQLKNSRHTSEIDAGLIARSASRHETQRSRALRQGRLIKPAVEFLQKTVALRGWAMKTRNVQVTTCSIMPQIADRPRRRSDLASTDAGKVRPDSAAMGYSIDAAQPMLKIIPQVIFWRSAAIHREATAMLVVLGAEYGSSPHQALAPLRAGRDTGKADHPRPSNAYPREEPSLPSRLRENRQSRCRAAAAAFGKLSARSAAPRSRALKAVVKPISNRRSPGEIRLASNGPLLIHPLDIPDGFRRFILSL